MAAYRRTITRGGQVTIPIAIRRALNLDPGARVTIEQQGDAVVVRRAPGVAERTAGMLAGYRKYPPLSPDEERAWFEQAVADEVASESG